jgi:hypothetical protein
MAFTDLELDEQGAITEYLRMIRAWAGEQARTNNHADALNTMYTHIQAALASVGTDEEIPDSTGLAGAMGLTKGELVSLTAHMQGILANYNTLGHRQMWAKAAGPSNLIG